MMETPEEVIAKLEADYEASTRESWAIGAHPQTISTGAPGRFTAADAAHIVSIHNATPALLAVARAMQRVADAGTWWEANQIARDTLFALTLHARPA